MYRRKCIFIVDKFAEPVVNYYEDVKKRLPSSIVSYLTI